MTADGTQAVRRLGSQYELFELLGSGGMGDVYRGRRVDTQEPVAIKLLKPELAQDRGVVARFIQESDVIVKVKHPHIVAVHDLVVEGGTMAIVMDLVVGDDLRRVMLSRSGPFEPAIAFSLCAQVLDALAAVHARGVLHRDVKPENVLIPTGDVLSARLADFGIAKVVDDRGIVTTHSAIIGTPYYMSPEVGEGETASPASDLYSVGCMLYELVAGTPPFSGNPVAVLRRHSDEAPTPIPGLPEATWKVIAHLLQKSPTDRPVDATAAAAELRLAIPSLEGMSALPTFRPGKGERVYQSPLPAPAGPPSDIAAKTAVRQRSESMPSPAAAPDSSATSLRVPSVHREAPPEVARRRRRLLPIGGAIAALVLVVGVAVIATRGSGDSAGSQLYRRAFPAQKDTLGSTIDRVWTVGGANGRTLTSEVTVKRGSLASSSYLEVIPKLVARDVSLVQFDPAPDEIVDPDPVVRYDLTTLGVGDSLVLKWRVELQASVAGDTAQMDALADAYFSASGTGSSAVETSSASGSTVDTVQPSTTNTVSITTPVPSTAAVPTSATGAVEPSATTSRPTTTLRPTATTAGPVPTTAPPKTTLAPTTTPQPTTTLAPKVGAVSISMGAVNTTASGTCTVGGCKYVVISSSGWAPGQSLTVTCSANIGPVPPFSRTADSAGNFNSSSLCMFGQTGGVHVTINSADSNYISPWFTQSPCICKG